MFISSAVMVASVMGCVVRAEKVGYISSSEVISNSKIGKEIREKLDNEFKKSSAEIQAEEQRIAKAVNDFKAKESTMTDSAREAEGAKIMKMRRDFESRVQEKEEEIKHFQAKLNDQFTKEALQAAESLAHKKELDAVVDIDSGKVMYVSSTAVYTKEFTDCLNKNTDAQSAKAAPQGAKNSSNVKPAAKA